MNNYQRVARAIDFIRDHYSDQPKLEEIAQAVHLSPWHFHRLFREWAGVTPKEFLQYISLNRTKRLLAENISVSETAHRAGFSSSSRLHDLFVKIEAMTPAEYRNGGRNLQIHYNFGPTPFGDVLIATTERGVCTLHFAVNRKAAVRSLASDWPNATIREGSNGMIEEINKVFSGNWDDPEHLNLHIRGTKFQIKVWEALLKIPPGRLATYSDIAGEIGRPKATRAVGTAIGRNPVSILIPCHRVIRKSGEVGNYYWGSTRKTALIGWEAVKTEGTDT